MAIKKLQNNFTTPEQSESLLELGVPADSADCYLQYDNFQGFYRRRLFDEGYEKSSQMHMLKGDLPCWSVGRLIELLVTCAIDEDYVKCIIEGIARYAAQVETYVNVITYLCKKKELDFSKLED